jgi:hypothetical protein
MKWYGIIALGLVLGLCPLLASAEEQVRDQSGVVVEIRQPFGNMSYAYDGNRNPLYVATSIPGNQEVVEYRDNRGVYMTIGGPGTIQWAQNPVVQFGTSGESAAR